VLFEERTVFDALKQNQRCVEATPPYPDAVRRTASLHNRSAVRRTAPWCSSRAERTILPPR
jgi:hypothetical protein